MQTTPESKKIFELPEFVVNQIKAGEVIERPSALVKEIVENALDAGATKIDLIIRDAGLELIKISDNGSGIEFSDLPMAFKRHATSKIRDFSDIFEIYSYGFRGEALASISAISKIKCQSTPVESNQCGELIIEGGSIVSHEKFPGQEQGTQIEIRNLFYNTPVRLKFMKSQIAERKAIGRIINSFLLNWKNVDFTIQWDDQSPIRYSRCADIKERVCSIFFPKIQAPSPDKIIYFKENFDDISVHFFASKSASKGGAKKQFLFVNERLFQDKNFHHFIMRQMAKVWNDGASGHYALYISIPTDQIDVNIHPSKTHIKFEDESALFSLFARGLRTLAPTLSTHTTLETNSIQGNLPPENHIPEESGHSFFQFENFNNSQIPLDVQTSTNHASLNRSRSYTNQEGTPCSINVIGPDYFCVYFTSKQDENYFLIRTNLFLKELFKNLVSTFTLTPIPLIISDPIANHDLQESELLTLNSQFGIELERLDQSTLVVRSIPDSLSRLPYRSIIQDFIDYYAINKTLDFSKITFSNTLAMIEPNHLIHAFEKTNLSEDNPLYSVSIGNLFTKNL